MQPQLLEWEALKKRLPQRARDCHKGSNGHVLVVGGAPGYSGSVRLAAEAAARIGAGLVTVATHPDHAAFINIGRPELMCYGVMQPDQLDPLLAKANIIVLGPGLGQAVWGPALATKILEYDKPVLVDADGLRFLSHHTFCRPNWILTPHPGEAASLLHISPTEVQQNRLKTVMELQQRYGGTVVLKGLETLVAASTDQLYLSPYGNPAMATAGMGDVLSGIIAGLWAQGLTQDDAAQLGVVLHALTADYLVNQKHYRTLLAKDITDCLAWIVSKL